MAVAEDFDRRDVGAGPGKNGECGLRLHGISFVRLPFENRIDRMETMTRKHYTLLMIFATVGFYVVGGVSSFRFCFCTYQDLIVAATWQDYFVCGSYIMGWHAAAWLPVMLLFWFLWSRAPATSQADKSR